MNSLVLAVIAFVGYLICYRLYGGWLSKKLFCLDPAVETPAVRLNDQQDFVPTRTEVLFGHHYTSIAGTGPIVGPALAIIWGWVPAFIWILCGPILIGAIHDFGALVISVRNDGETIGDTAGDLISPRVRTIFMVVLVLLLLMVIAIFGMVIASIFALYPQSVFPIWAEIPIAMALGHAIYKRNVKPGPASLLAVATMYVTIWIGSKYPVVMPELHFGSYTVAPVVTWTVILMAYAYIASTLPVWKLLQPRDYINGHELYVVLAILILGVLVERPPMVAPAFQPSPEGAPPIFPFLFITVACGAVSGFHSLVSSGTTSKQLGRETDALPIGFGGMLLEGVLAVLVLIAVGAGIGCRPTEAGALGLTAWRETYASWGAAQGLGPQLGAFVRGSANMLEGIGLHHGFAMTVMGVFVASFAGTTLDTSARIQRYIISEVAEKANIKVLTKTHPATLLACGSALLMAMIPPAKAIGEQGLLHAMLAEGGKGGLVLWPLFGAGNQLLAGLGLTVITVYLMRLRKPSFMTLVPMVFMLTVTLLAMLANLKTFAAKHQYHLLVIDAVVLALAVWMVAEAVQTMLKLRRDNLSGVVRERPVDDGEE